ncbi:MAG TPA: SRPBCC family protein [Acidimicrobiia bacterium]|nr:SRPBCC family protein [Acidimicrobiia bacterium]
MPSGTFSHAVVVRARPADVWTRLQDAETWSGIGPIDDVWDATHGDDGVISGYRWSATAAGRSWKGTARTTEAVPEERLTLTLTSSEVRGTLTTKVSPTGEGSHLTVTLKVETVGMLSTLFWGVVRTAMEHGLPKQVEDFGAKFD